MNTYHKIQTVFKRNLANNSKTLLIGQYSRPEFEFLKDCDWVWTEKIDGMNIRVMWDMDMVWFGGKSDNAQIPADLFTRLVELFPLNGETFKRQFDSGPVCLYGEGYGAGIQKAGVRYGPRKDFILFDVKVGEWWLQREDVEGIAETMGLSIVPITGCGSLMDMVHDVRDLRCPSILYDGPAEGLVARPKVELFARNGQRIITKLKVQDFQDAR